LLKVIKLLEVDKMKMIDLVGFDRFDDDTVEDVKGKLKPLAEKYDRTFGTDSIQNFKVAVESFKRDGGKDIHEVVMSLNTTKGNFRAKKQGWEILSLVDEVESNLERQVREKKEKMLKQREGRNA
jgi:ribosome-associated translation inhibitor RaiA